MSNGKALVVVDLSNWLYYTIMGCVSNWSKFSVNASNLKSPDETDQDNLPDLMIYPDFERTLNEYVHKRLDTVNWIVTQNHADEMAYCDSVDVVFTMDDSVSKSFRKARYPGYKSQRKLIRRNYDIAKIRSYILDVIFPSLGLETNFGYKFIKVDGCESDDIIATIMKKFTDYEIRILISSDHDFLQLKDVYQYDMAGNPVKRVVCGTEVSPEDYLLWKIIRGDSSDNISGVFSGVGEKKSLKLVNDKPTLMKKLSESQDSARQFAMNKVLIDFKCIPKPLEDRICEELGKNLSTVKKSEKSLLMEGDDLMSL